MNPPTWGPLRSFGRIKSRTLKPRQAALMETLLPRLALPDPAQGPIDPRILMPGALQVWLEVGFGGGEHLAEQARRQPEVLMLGCEPFLNGVGSLLRQVDDSRLANVRLHPGDAREIMDALPDASLDRVFILFPDPWPKARHHKRRLIQPQTLAAIVRTLKPGGSLRFATDWRDYAAWTLERALATPGLEWTAQAPGDWRTPPLDHSPTRYQHKLLGDTDPIWLEFHRSA